MGDVNMTTASVPSRHVRGEPELRAFGLPPGERDLRIPPTDPSRKLKKNATNAALNPNQPAAPPTIARQSHVAEPHPLRVDEVDADKGPTNPIAAAAAAACQSEDHRWSTAAATTSNGARPEHVGYTIRFGTMWVSMSMIDIATSATPTTAYAAKHHVRPEPHRQPRQHRRGRDGLHQQACWCGLGSPQRRQPETL